MLKSFHKRHIVVSCLEWGAASEQEEQQRNVTVKVMEKCRTLAERGILKIGFDFAGSTTADTSEEEAKRWKAAFDPTLELCCKEQWRHPFWRVAFLIPPRPPVDVLCRLTQFSYQCRKGRYLLLHCCLTRGAFRLNFCRVLLGLEVQTM